VCASAIICRGSHAAGSSLPDGAIGKPSRRRPALLHHYYAIDAVNSNPRHVVCAAALDGAYLPSCDGGGGLPLMHLSLNRSGSWIGLWPFYQCAAGPRWPLNRLLINAGFDQGL